jgi:hypothetical protein
MAAYTREQLTAKWVDGFIPKEEDFADLFDSITFKQSDAGATVSSEQPTNTNLMWVDSTNLDNLVLKVFVEGNWIPLNTIL